MRGSGKPRRTWESKVEAAYNPDLLELCADCFSALRDSVKNTDHGALHRLASRPGDRLKCQGCGCWFGPGEKAA